MRPANGRAHLSIGEVLSLLQDEFPDVTISKIRFLESQGLLDPERTPSGYRKFYDADIARLRWILRQQKENYLPLKVIKDRLDDNGGEVPDDAYSDQGEGADAEAEGGILGVRHLSARSLDASYRNGASATALQPRDVKDAPARVTGAPEQWRESVHDTLPLDVDHAEVAKARVLPEPPPPPAPPLSGAPPRRRPDAAEAPAARVANGRTAAPEEAAAPATQGGAAEAGQARRAETEVQRRRPPVPRQTVPQAPRREDVQPADRLANAAVGSSDVSLTLDELAEASGLSPKELRELEKFGLIEPLDQEGAPVYDGDALVVAHTAAGFFQHGIEARHLRMYKVAMEREAALFEQVVAPVLKQRNPDARRRAARTITELIRLGEVMRGSLLRDELGDHLRGGA
jgi:DNA-binding transcriptional MerR regulator